MLPPLYKKLKMLVPSRIPRENPSVNFVPLLKSITEWREVVHIFFKNNENVQMINN